MGEQRELLFDQVDIPGPEEIPDKTDTISDDWLLQGQRLTGALQYPSTIVPLFVAALAVMLIILEAAVAPG